MSKFTKAILPGTIVSVLAVAAWVLFLLGSVVVGASFKLAKVAQAPEVPYAESALFYFLVAIGVSIFGFIWFIPTTIAAFRECRSYWGILVLNLVPGLGHLVAFVWALVEQPPQPAIVQHFHQPSQNPHQ